jgi:hypothetical protein
MPAGTSRHRDRHRTNDEGIPRIERTDMQPGLAGLTS